MIPTYRFKKINVITYISRSGLGSIAVLIIIITAIVRLMDCPVKFTSKRQKTVFKKKYAFA